jgi:hypothetical protein
MRTHLTVIGGIFMALGGFWLVIALIVFVSVVGGGLLSRDAQVS